MIPFTVSCSFMLRADECKGYSPPGNIVLMSQHIVRFTTAGMKELHSNNLEMAFRLKEFCEHAYFLLQRKLMRLFLKSN